MSNYKTKKFKSKIKRNLIEKKYDSSPPGVARQETRSIFKFRSSINVSVSRGIVAAVCYQ